MLIHIQLMNWGMYGKRSHVFGYRHRERHHPPVRCFHRRPADKPYDNRSGCVVACYSDDCSGNHRRYPAHWPAMISMTCNGFFFRSKRTRSQIERAMGVSARTASRRKKTGNINWNWLMFKQLVSISTAEIHIHFHAETEKTCTKISSDEM